MQHGITNSVDKYEYYAQIERFQLEWLNMEQ